MDTQILLNEFLTEEIFRTHFVHGCETFTSLIEACDNFIYIHSLTSFKICEDLSDDFEVSGYAKYNINAESDLFLELTFNYEDGGLDNIEYEVKNKELFNSLVDYSLKVVNDNIKESIKEFV